MTDIVIEQIYLCLGKLSYRLPKGKRSWIFGLSLKSSEISAHWWDSRRGGGGCALIVHVQKKNYCWKLELGEFFLSFSGRSKSRKPNGRKHSASSDGKSGLWSIFSRWRPAIAFLYPFLFYSLLFLVSFLSQKQKWTHRIITECIWSS